MNPLRHLLLSSYYHTTLPSRHAARRRRAADGLEPISILFYHRVADGSPNAWTMRTKTFRRQIDWITKRFEVVSLAEAQRRIASGFNTRPTVALTFDDGYADNCDGALPLLLRRRLPFTYFVTSGNVLDGTPFPHDLAAGAPLRPNTPEQIRALATAGVDIGAHTRTHPDLGKIVDPEHLRDEIGGSKQDLEELTGRPVRHFAFPFGLPANLSAAAFAAARQAGFQAACSAYGAYNFPGEDSFHLQRVHADPELVRLKNWLTIDPRKTSVPRFETGEDQAARNSTVETGA